MFGSVSSKIWSVIGGSFESGVVELWLSGDYFSSSIVLLSLLEDSPALSSSSLASWFGASFSLLYELEICSDALFFDSSSNFCFSCPLRSLEGKGVAL